MDKDLLKPIPQFRANTKLETMPFCSETQIGNRLLRSRLQRGRVLFSDAERRTLATLAKEIGTEALRALDPLVSPATLLRWHRQLVAQKWTFLERRRPGRARTKIDVEQLVVRMTRENPGWGYTRIHGALRNLDIKVGRGTIRRILKDHLIESAPARFVIDLATRHVVIAGITMNPNEVWMLQMARNLTDAETGMLRGTRHLIVDRDTKFSKAFRTFLAREGVEVIRLPPRSPNLNAFAERFVRSVKSECLSKLIPIGVPMLRRAMHEYMEHYHRDRNHQGLANELIVPLRVSPSRFEPVGRRARLGGMLSYYERAAA